MTLLITILINKSAISLNDSEDMFIFFDEINSKTLLKWKFVGLDYQVPERWSLKLPPFEKGDTISIGINDNPSNYPHLIGNYLQDIDERFLLGFFKNNTAMNLAEYEWLSDVFGKTPFPFLPITSKNESGQYNYLELYYQTLKEIEGTESNYTSTDSSSYNYTIKLEPIKRTNYLIVYETITETSDLNTTLFYYFQHWKYFTDVRINLRTGIVEKLELEVTRKDMELDYVNDLKYDYLADIHYILDFIDTKARNIVITVSFSIIPLTIFSLIFIKRNQRQKINIKKRK
jgi:hypothetical protein